MPLPALPALPALPSLTPRSSLIGSRLASQLPPLSPEEEDSLLEHIWKGGLGVVSWLGEVLAKPARVLYALPSGKPRELLNIIPFSDTLGATDPTDMASPSATLENMGVLPENEEGLDWWDVPRFVADVVGDPLSHIGLGAKAAGAAGRAVQNAGLWGKLPALTGATKRVSQIGTTINDLMPHLSQAQIDALHTAVGPTGKTLAEIGDEPLRGLARASFMGMSSPNEVLLGTGPMAQKVAGTLDKYGSKVRYSRAGTVPAALIDTPSMGFVEPEYQAAGPGMFNEIQELQAGGRAKTAKWVHHMEDAVNDPAASSQLRGLGEGLTMRGTDQRLRDVAADMVVSKNAKYRQLHDVGLDAGLLDEEWEHSAHFPRQAIKIQGTKRLPTRFDSGSQKSYRLGKREDILRGLPGMTGGGEVPPHIVEGVQIRPRRIAPGANELLMDARVWDTPLDKVAIKDTAQYIRERYLDMPDSIAGLPEATPGQLPGQRTDARFRFLNRIKDTLDAEGLDELRDLRKTRQQSRKLIPFIQGLPQNYREVPFFGNHPLVDWESYDARVSGLIGWGKGVANVLGDSAVPTPAAFADDLAEKKFKTSTVPLSQAMANIGFKQGAKLHPKAVENMVAKLAAKGIVPAGTKTSDVTQLLDQVRVPIRLYDDALKSFELLRDPKQLDAIRNALGRITNLWKAGATSTIRFNTRNVTTGLWMNFVNGMVDERFSKLDPRRYLNPLTDARKLAAGDVLDDLGDIPLLRGLTPQAATQKLQQLVYEHSILGRGTLTKELAETIGMSGVNPQQTVPAWQVPRDTLRAIEEQIPGQIPRGAVKDRLKAAYREKGSLNPLAVAGVTTPDDKFLPVRAMRAIGRSAEEQMRVGGFIALLRKGVEPAEASRRVATTHVNYADLTRFEKRNLRTLAPFYTFHSRVMPQVFKHLLERPGGATRNVARLGEHLRDEEGVLPDRVTGSTAIPLSENEDGEKTYLTRFVDLPHESLNSMIRFGPGGLQKTLSSLGSFLHPIPKAAIELGTGHQLYDNQDLRDKDGRIGRMLTTLGVLDDPRQLPGRQLTETLANVVPYAGTLTSHLGTLLDERKGPLTKAASLLTGAQTATVGARDKENALRQIIENELRGEPGVSVFESLYAPNPELLSPDEQLLLRLNKTITQRRQKANRAEAKAGSGAL